MNGGARADSHTLASASRACAFGCPKAPLLVDVMRCRGSLDPWYRRRDPWRLLADPRRAANGGKVLLAYSNGLLNYNIG